MPHSISDHPQATANLAAISFSKLLQEDKAEVQALGTACKKSGFFYLDLEGRQSREYLNLVENVFKDANQYFSQPLEAKMKNHMEDCTLANLCGCDFLGDLSRTA